MLSDRSVWEDGAPLCVDCFDMRAYESGYQLRWIPTVEYASKENQAKISTVAAILAQKEQLEKELEQIGEQIGDQDEKV